MKRFAIALLVIFFSISIIPLGKLQVSAAETGNNGISIYPAFTELSVGESYILTIQNNSDKPENIEITPEVFSINSDKENLEPIPLKSRTDLNIDLKNNLSISDDSVLVKAGEKKEIKIEYKEALEKYILGVKIQKESDIKSNVAVGFNLASLILDLDLSEEDLEKITQDIKIDSSFNIGNIYFGNDFKIKYVLNNGTSKILKAYGEIIVKDNNKRLEQYSLTSDLQKSIYPSKNVEVSKEFTDTRSFSERVGTLTFNTNANLNNREVEFSKTIYILPIETLIIAVLFLPSLIILLFLFKKRSKLLGRKTSNNKSKKHKRVSLGQRKN